MTMMTMDDGEDDSAVEELELDLNQLRKTRSDLAPDNLDADGLVMATKESWSLSVDEIVKVQLPQPAETVENTNSDDEVLNTPVSPPSRNEVDRAIEILTRLTLFTTDSELDPLLQKASNKINQRGLDKMKQSSIADFFSKRVNSIDYGFCTSTIFMVTAINKIDISHKKEFVLFRSLYYTPRCLF